MGEKSLQKHLTIILAGEIGKKQKKILWEWDCISTDSSEFKKNSL